MSFWRKLFGQPDVAQNDAGAPTILHEQSAGTSAEHLLEDFEAKFNAEVQAEASQLTIVRVRAKSDPDEYRTIQFHTGRAELSCDCDGFDGTICAHIDAVLIAGERYMVHRADWHAADEVAALVAPITPPPGWKGSWRRDKVWRGLETQHRKSPTPSRRHEALGIAEEDFSLRPGVVFTGQFPESRTALADEAEQHGWRTLGTVTTQAKVLVTGEVIGANKLRAAKANGIMIVDLETWRSTHLRAS